MLSFYAVALGLFASYLTYRISQEQKSLVRQESLRPKIELILELDDDDINTKLCVNNLTDNDYFINYIGFDYYEADEHEYLNANEKIELTLNCWDEYYPKSVQIGIKDTDRNEWSVGFEHQEDSHKYCRTFIDHIA